MPKPNKNKKMKGNLGNNTYEQKENRAKKRKANTSDTDGIAMSSQLRIKKMRVQTESRAKRQKNNPNRLCSNGKPMPSLADLELLFEDSDGDDEDYPPKARQESSQERSTTPVIPVINPDILISPNTRTKITNQVKDILSINSRLIPFSSSITEKPPPEKLMELDTNDNELHNLPNINTESNNNGQQLMIDDGISSDSKNNIKNNITPSRLHTNSVLRTFSPKPSTSKDNETFIINDELFNKSLKEIAAVKDDVQKRDDDEDLQVIEMPIETIMVHGKKEIVNIENDLETHNLTALYKPTEEIVKIENDLETHNLTALNKPTEVVGSVYNTDDDDDDCVIIETTTNTIEHKADPIEIIDIDYPSTLTPTKNNNIDDEIIDIDALIAQNQTVLDQSRKFASKNLVIDVDYSTTAYNSSTGNSNISPEAAKKCENGKYVELGYGRDIAAGSTKSVQNVKAQRREATLQRTNIYEVRDKVSNPIPEKLKINQLKINNIVKNFFRMAKSSFQVNSETNKINLTNNSWRNFFPSLFQTPDSRRNGAVPQPFPLYQSQDTNNTPRLLLGLVNPMSKQTPKHESKNKKTNDEMTIPKHVENNIMPPSPPQQTSGKLETKTNPISQSKDQLYSELILENANNDNSQLQPRTGNLYTELMQLEQQPLVQNAENFECGICMVEYLPGCGVVLRDCVHTFCKECLSDVVRYCEEPEIACPASGCRGMLQEREIRALVSSQDYERWLERGLSAAESGTRNAFHCRTSDCKGWALCDPGVQVFPCPVCKNINCILCQAIHESETCDEYRCKLLLAAGKGKVDDKTKKLLSKWITKGSALECPECRTILTKITGCDWVKCSACKTEICWATRGRRWGPRGTGDITGGCRCGVNRKRCHPSCKNCH